MNYEGKKILVMGLGRFGGGVGVTRFLAGRGATVTVTDLLDQAQLSHSLDKLSGLPVQYRLGEHRESDFTAADLIVVNPAVDPRNNSYLAAARKANIPTTSEIQLLASNLPGETTVIGVTGSAGKSTVTAMLGHLLGKSLDNRNVHVGGNLGGSLLDKIDRINPNDIVVLELSSFMLELLDCDRWSPNIAVVTNIAENHLDRHGDMAGYIRAKQTIIRHQAADDVAVLPADFADTTPPWRSAGKTIYIVQPDIAYPLLLPGRHNQLNAHYAFTAAAAALPGKSLDNSLLVDFPGLPHRLQFVCEKQNVRFYNDSKSTTPDAAVLAVGSFPENTVHLILGGSDKGSDFRTLARVSAGRCAAVYTIGHTGPVIAELCRHANPDTAVHESKTLDMAFAAAVANAKPGQNIVLSPACASFDQFANYEQRGEAFIKLCSGVK